MPELGWTVTTENLINHIGNQSWAEPLMLLHSFAPQAEDEMPVFLCDSGQGNKNNRRKSVTKGKVMKNVEICRHLIPFYFPRTNENSWGL